MNHPVGLSSLKTLLIQALLVSIALASCSEGANRSTDLNLPIVFQDADVHILGQSESIAVVRGLEVLPNGSVWILNSSSPYFLGFDSNGTPLGSHGESGDGPSEFQLPTAFVTGASDAVWVFDYRRHALINISESTQDWAEILIPHDSLPPGSLAGGMNMLASSVRTARLGDEVIFARTNSSMIDGVFAFRVAVLRPDLMALDTTTGAVRRIISLSEVMEDPSLNLEKTTSGFPLWFRLWTTCQENEIIVYDRVRDELRSFGRDGAESPPTSLRPIDLSSATPRQIARVVYGLRAAEVAGAVGRRLTAEDSLKVINDLASRLGEERTQFAAYLPRYVDLRCGSDGTIWLHPFDLDEGGLAGGRTWLRMSRDGEPQEVRLPDRFDALRFTKDQIWGVQRDEFDVASVAWIELPG